MGWRWLQRRRIRRTRHLAVGRGSAVPISHLRVVTSMLGAAAAKMMFPGEGHAIIFIDWAQMLEALIYGSGPDSGCCNRRLLKVSSSHAAARGPTPSSFNGRCRRIRRADNSALYAPPPPTLGATAHRPG